MDLGDKTSRYCVLGEQGEIVQEGSVGTTKKALAQKFGALRRCRMAMEVGTHSPWVSRLLKSLGHEVIVANARQVKLISQSSRKDDRLDAQTLARLARVDPQLLRHPAPQRRSASALDGDSGASGTGGNAQQPGEHSARVGQVGGGTATKM